MGPGEFGQQRKVRCRRFVGRRNAHQALNRQAKFFAAQGDEIRRVARRHAGFLRLLTRVHLDKQNGLPMTAVQFGAQGMCELRPVQRVDCIEKLDGFTDLVRLQWSDEMQLNIGIFVLQSRPFRFCFVNPVFAKHALPCIDHRADVVRTEGLGNGDKSGAGSRQNGGLSCRLDAGENIAPCMDGRGFVRISDGGHGVGNELARETLARAAARFNRNHHGALPGLVFLTDDERTPDPVPTVRALPRGSLVILRSRQRSRRVALVEGVKRVAGPQGLHWLVADDPELASLTGAGGVHFPEARITEAHHWRAIRPRWLITCTAHSLGVCARIARAGANAALLSPAFPTESHAGRPALGSLCVRIIAGQSPVPVYALGGVDSRTARRLEGARLAGLAAVGALAV